MAVVGLNHVKIKDSLIGKPFKFGISSVLSDVDVAA